MPDTGRGTCVPGIGGCATSSHSKERGEVHCPTSPFEDRTSPGQLLRFKAAGGARSGRRYVEKGTKPGWRIASAICTAGCTAALTERSHREECTYRKPTA